MGPHRRLLIGVSDDQPGGGQRQDREMAVDFIAIERGFVMDDELHHLFCADRNQHRILDQGREIATGLQIAAQGRTHVHVPNRPTVRESHWPIVP